MARKHIVVFYPSLERKITVVSVYFFNTINQSAATSLVIIFFLITIIIRLNKHVDFVNFKYLSWHSSQHALRQPDQLVRPDWKPAARDGKTASRLVRVFHSARGNCQHNSRKLHLWGAPLSSVAGGPERRSYFPPFSSTLAGLMWASELARELASSLLPRRPARNTTLTWQKTLVSAFCSILVAGNENSPLGCLGIRLQLCNGCDESP